MSEQQQQAITDILIRAEKITQEAECARDNFKVLARILVGSVFVAISVVSILIWQNKRLGEDVQFLRKDYAPLWTLTMIQQSDDYEVQEIAATFGATEVDKEKLNEIINKYNAFKNMVINQIATMRGGNTNINRAIRSNSPDGGGGP